MDKRTKILISEYVNKTSGMSNEKILQFFSRNQYKKLKSFKDESDLLLLSEYTMSVLNIDLNIDLEKQAKKGVETGNEISNKIAYPNTYISLLLTDESLSSIGSIIRLPYCKFDDIEKLVKVALLEHNIDDDIIKQFNSVIDNKHLSDHSIDFLYYIYMGNRTELTPVFEFDFENIKDESTLIYSKYLDSLLMSSFDKDVIKKIKEIKKRLLDE